MQVKGKIAIINGASSGIGKSVALELARQGAIVVICARREDKLKEAFEEIRPHSPQSMFKVCDCSQDDQVKQTVKAVYQKYGRIDIMMNVAGIFEPKLIIDSTVEDYYRDINVCFLGSVRFIAEVLPIMVAQQSGVILNTSSINEHVHPPAVSAYAAAKAAIYAYSDTLYKEVKSKGIHVGVIQPALVETEMTVADEGQEKSLEEISKEIAEGSYENYRALNAYLNIQAPELSAKEIIKNGVVKERFEIFTGEPRMWTVYGLMMKMLPGIGRGFFAMMMGKMESSPEKSSGKGSTKMMNTMFSLFRPLATVLRESYVRLDEGLNRIIFNSGSGFKK